MGLDKAVIVTGASSGIGAAIAVEIAGAGARVLLVGRDPGRLEDTRTRIADGGGTGTAMEADVTDAQAPARIVEAALDRIGGIDVLIHAAGIFWPKPFGETTLEDFDRQWEVNVRAPFALTQAAMPHLGQGASVIFISSIAGHVGFPNSSAYCATKGAIELLTKALTLELAQTGIRFNCIAPGNIRTPMNEHLLADPTYEQAMLAATPSGRIGIADEVAPAALFLASDASRYIHGVSLLVDGGWAAK